MHRLIGWTLIGTVVTGLMAAPWCFGQADEGPMRVAIAGLVHGHVAGFLGPALKRSDIKIVGIAEPDQALARQYADEFKLDRNLLHSEVEEMLAKVKPQALLVFTDTRDHRKVVEATARHGVPVMMEKPLAISMEDALAIQRAAESAKIPVLVNYETTWYPNTVAMHGLVREGALGDIRKVVVQAPWAERDWSSARISPVVDGSCTQRRRSAV